MQHVQHRCIVHDPAPQLLHGMEATTNAMLAQFAAGLVHFSDYKRCKVIGDLLGVEDVTKPPPLGHRSALFLFKFLAELRSVSTIERNFSTTAKPLDKLTRMLWHSLL